MNHNNFNIPTNMKNGLFNPCTAKGVCSPSPSLYFMHQCLISYLHELSFYLVKLKTFGITNSQIKEIILNIISSITLNLEYSENYFLSQLSILYSNLLEAKELYISVCRSRNINAKNIKSKLKNPQKMTFPEAIKLGQDLSMQRFKSFTDEQKQLYEIGLNVIKSLCVHIIELKDLEIEEEGGYFALLTLLNAKRIYGFSKEVFFKTINRIVKLDNNLLKKLHATREERYGQIIPTEVRTSTRPNKAILVTGTNLRELELLLEATKGKGIDIYTHGHMIMAHSFPKFQKYPHLFGHWGRGPETYLLDFAEFPGAILITKHSFQQIENLFRSRVFSTDIISARGVVLIKNHNFEPLIQSAIEAKGFTYERERPFIKLSLDEKATLNKIDEIADKIKSKEIKNFITIGVSNNTKRQRDYFDKFVHLLTGDCFAVSFSYHNTKNNMLFVQSDYGFPLLYKVIDVILAKNPIYTFNLAVLFTRCEIHTISNVIYMKSLGIKDLYFTDCQPTLINPAVVTSMRNLLGLKNYTTPENDFSEMTKDVSSGES